VLGAAWVEFRRPCGQRVATPATAGCKKKTKQQEAGEEIPVHAVILSTQREKKNRIWRRKKNNRRWFQGQEKLMEAHPGGGGKGQSIRWHLVSDGKRSILKKYLLCLMQKAELTIF
jgi:hypothetical protein